MTGGDAARDSDARNLASTSSEENVKSSKNHCCIKLVVFGRER